MTPSIPAALDFRAECDALAELLQDADENVWMRETLFKAWTVEDVIAHLFMWNEGARLTLENPNGFQDFLKGALTHLMGGKSHQETQRLWLNETQDGLSGVKLYDAWRATYGPLSEAYAMSDPEKRLAWGGPEMSAQACIIARQMECWAHGHEIFDALGQVRRESDRLRNIAHLGVTTYGWTFRNRAETPPASKPYVQLIGPSGAEWTWNEPQSDNAVRGEALAFCQVVTQTRNVADTKLEVVGETAVRWMEIAQCFAGPPETPPAKGARRLA